VATNKNLEPQSGEPMSPPSERKGGGANVAKSVVKSPRHRAREFIVQGLYQWQVGGQDMAAIRVQAESVPGFDKSNLALYQTLLDDVMTNGDGLRELLQPHISRPWEEISPIERGILLLAACELKDHIETPYRVVINEAIELSKTFGGTDGHKFVNGVLDKLAPQLRPTEAVPR
jgi:transcription antitermination protein NusB